MCPFLTRLSTLAVVLFVGANRALTGESILSPPFAPEACAAAPIPERIQVLVELVDAPALRVYQASLAASTSRDPAEKEAAARAAERAQDQRIKEAQAAVARGLAGLGARELYRVRRSFNGLAVVVGSDKLDDLRTLSGVKAVHTGGPTARPRVAVGPSESKPSPQAADTGVQAPGLRAYVDPSGRLTGSPTEAQAAELERLLGDLANRSSEGLEVVTLSDGSQIADLRGRFRNYSAASVSSNGAVSLHCDGHVPSGRATTPAPPSTSLEK